MPVVRDKDLVFWPRVNFILLLSNGATNVEGRIIFLGGNVLFLVLRDGIEAIDVQVVHFLRVFSGEIPL